jgi:hypothetical protein
MGKCSFPVIITAGLLVNVIGFAQRAPSDLPRVELSSTPELIYSANSNDPWNKIFYFLFSRKLTVRLSSDFAEGAPFIDRSGQRKVSSRVFEKDETGDRAIDPMYPTFAVGFGGMLVLSDSAYPVFTRALSDAVAETPARSASARALMQSDLWGAYDALFSPFLPDDERALGERRKAALDLIAHLIRKIALTPQEIEALPENYSSAVRRDRFPDVFAKDSGWIEIAWFLPRTHDDHAGYRRVSRVFLKPAQPPQNVQRFLEAQTVSDPDVPSGLAGVALITQLLLIDSHGNPQPTKLTSEAQIRLFVSGAESGTLTGTMRTCEISRKLFLQDSQSGGLVAEDANTPAYLSNGGSYGFAEGQLMPVPNQSWGEPIRVKLRSRCAACHGENLAQLMTFSVIRPPHPPQIRQLSAAGTTVADLDIHLKRRQKEFQALLGYFK